MPKNTHSTTDDIIAGYIADRYSPTSVQDIHRIFTRLFPVVLEHMLAREMADFLETSPGNYNNGYTRRTLRTLYGEQTVLVPRDRFSQFHSRILPKHQRTLPEITCKVKALHQAGFSRRSISVILEALYDCNLSHQAVSDIIRD